MTQNSPFNNSIYNLPPLERGGVEARIGFVFQDHVAATFLIELLENPDLLEVWCETHDDITLIWRLPSHEVEFVQVKGHALDQLWSVAKLVQRDRKEKQAVCGSSIYERSLANDRCSESCRFRLVTCLPPNSDLDSLCLPFDAPDRLAKEPMLLTLADDLDSRSEGYRSPNGNGASFWLSRVLWQVRQSIDTAEKENKYNLFKLLSRQGSYFVSDELDELYAALLAKACDAATRDWGTDPSRKKICKGCLSMWLSSYLTARRHPPIVGGARVQEKLRIAGIGEEDVVASMESRQRYLAERYSPKYLDSQSLSHLEAEVSAVLHVLRARLDSGDMPDDGVAFHAACLKAVESLRDRSNGNPPLSILQGCMYNIADRCIHRFRRASA